jgi:hypothetical protein
VALLSIFGFEDFYRLKATDQLDGGEGKLRFAVTLSSTFSEISPMN